VKGFCLRQPVTRTESLWTPRLIGLGLLFLTLVIYWPVLRFDFVNYDDDKYVTANPHVLAGLTRQSVAWAFHTTDANFWHPVTWLSHMADCQLYGPHPAGHHLTNLGLHLFNTLLLFGLWNRMTGACWRSAFVAALFAVHPLHVESVAWVAERKDVLSTFFGLLSLWAYIRYVSPSGTQSPRPVRSRNSGARREPKAQSPRSKVASEAGARSPTYPLTHSPTHSAFHIPHSAFWYGAALLFFALSLMSKPMLVTLPFLLLLLDYWPLRRLQLIASHQQLSTLLEKLPFLALSAIFGVVAVWAQKQGGSLMSLENLPLGSRLANALVSYARYMSKTVWPTHLAVPYPLVLAWPMWQVVGAALLLLAASIGAVAWARRLPFLFTGWFWFFGTLVPVIGFVQVGNYSLADRFTYLPSVGLFVVGAWGLHQLSVRWPRHRSTLVLLGLFLVGACCWRAAVQVQYWKSSETLFAHATSVIRNNYIAYNNLGTALDQSGQAERAMECFAQALRIKPDHPEAHINLALALTGQKKFAEAVAHYEAALRVAPADAQAHNNLANLLDLLGRTAEALPHYLAALQVKPDFPEAEYNLAGALARQGRLEDAITHYQTALRLAPQNASAHYNLAALLALSGRLPEAKDHYLATLRLNPGHASAHNNLGNLLVRLGEPQEAIAHFTAALQAEPDLAEAHYSLAKLLISEGKPEAARPHLREAMRLRPDWTPALNDLARSMDSSSSPKRSVDGSSP
jgi:tetratricopeptide (TPR) repeat protein